MAATIFEPYTGALATVRRGAWSTDDALLSAMIENVMIPHAVRGTFSIYVPNRDLFIASVVAAQLDAEIVEYDEIADDGGPDAIY